MYNEKRWEEDERREREIERKEGRIVEGGEEHYGAGE